ncbi:hypothetical protein QNI19_27115 [Cytophagaceae bacterium DM2B3-1]|uniref:Uncharacterized protein n=1 Tax=Xanthocytophaga flava TaxID=3048013 RepID=A0AAE3UAX3_9BACT|nr:hypothetical protein [Xanthocytophaga flavus]MDJ1471517.1 hypothetical protein [Xanthocytophaga flavus]MDJ1485177.1 hypothetical protein [Xanthocytophaga flavus]MDJ1496633.1 hypothetical protein [Xanthocytophaga flavus]
MLPDYVSIQISYQSVENPVQSKPADLPIILALALRYSQQEALKEQIKNKS